MKASRSIKALAAALAAVLVMVSGAFAQMAEPATYVITEINRGADGLESIFKADKNGSTTPIATGPIQTVINAIRDDVNCSDAFAPAAGCSGALVGNNAAIQFRNGTDDPNGNGVAIQFGDNTNVLDIGTASAAFGNVGGQRWGRINLSGKITSAIGIPATGDGSSGTVFIGSGIFVESSADIANTAQYGNAICVDGGGTVRISGGTVSRSAGGFAVQIPIGRVAASVILTGSPTITGTMNVTAGALSVELFSPAEKLYRLTVSGKAGDVAVAGGANFGFNFVLVNSGNLGLAASGNNLVLATPMYTVTIFNDYWSGNVIDSQKIPHGGKVTKPADPTREGYTLKRWYLWEECPPEPMPGGCIPNRTWDFDNDVVTRDILLDIEWEKSTSIAANRATAAKRFGISQNGASLQIVGTAQATNIRIYDMRGKLLLSRSAMPNETISVLNLARGTYVVKALGNSVRIVR
jgi:hypothetical protein